MGSFLFYFCSAFFLLFFFRGIYSSSLPPQPPWNCHSSSSAFYLLLVPCNSILLPNPPLSFKPSSTPPFPSPPPSPVTTFLLSFYISSFCLVVTLALPPSTCRHVFVVVMYFPHLVLSFGSRPGLSPLTTFDPDDLNQGLKVTLFCYPFCLG